jgi:NADP-dependent 3-hydroxy acid dehydrogenase YdfG
VLSRFCGGHFSPKVTEMTLPAAGIAMVTGAGSGIGRALAVALAHRGCRLLLVGRREGALHMVAKELPAAATVIVADLATEAGIQAVAEACPDHLDVLVHSAGLFHHGPIAGTPAAMWDNLTAVNLRAPMLLTSACLSGLRAAGGQIVFVNSTAGLQGAPGNGAYAATKQALRTAAETLRQDLRGSGLRVLSIFPGRTDTAMQREVLAGEGRPNAQIPLLQPEDVAQAVLSALLMSRRAEITELVIRPRNDCAGRPCHRTEDAAAQRPFGRLRRPQPPKMSFRSARRCRSGCCRHPPG